MSCVRQPFDPDTLLSPGFAKTIERTTLDPTPAIPLPQDIFKVDVNSYLTQFGDTTPLKPLNDTTLNSGRLNVTLFPTKQNPQLAAAQAELNRKVQAPVASRFGFTKH